MIEILLNGTPEEVDERTTVAELVARWCASPRGIAVARNGEIVPKSTWGEELVRAHDRLEIVTAAAGG